MKRVVLGATTALAMVAATAVSAGTLDDVRKRGELICIVNTGLTGITGGILDGEDFALPVLINALKTRTAELMVERGVVPTVLTSPHFVGSDAGAEQLENVYEEYFRRIQRAYDGEGAIPVPESWEAA